MHLVENKEVENLFKTKLYESMPEFPDISKVDIHDLKAIDNLFGSPVQTFANEILDDFT